jgi:hypothetical protein
VRSIAHASEIPNIEVSGELDMGEQIYGDLTFLITADFFSGFTCRYLIGDSSVKTPPDWECKDTKIKNLSINMKDIGVLE